MREIWNASHGNEATDRSIVGWWWALWLISIYAGRLVSQLATFSNDASGIATSFLVHSGLDGLDLALYVVTLKLVTRIGAAYRGLGYTPHTWTNGLGFLVNLHVYAAGPRSHPIEYPFEPPGWVPEARDGLLVEPIRVAADGIVAVPDAPGLGIELDEDRLARYGEKYFEITSSGLAIKTIRDKGLFTALKLARKKRR